MEIGGRSDRTMNANSRKFSKNSIGANKNDVFKQLLFTVSSKTSKELTVPRTEL
jgi:hypothetical protein